MIVQLEYVLLIIIIIYIEVYETINDVYTVSKTYNISTYDINKKKFAKTLVDPAAACVPVVYVCARVGSTS